VAIRADASGRREVAFGTHRSTKFKNGHVTLPLSVRE